MLKGYQPHVTFVSLSFTLLRIICKLVHMASMNGSLSRMLTSSLQFPRHPMLVCPTSHLTDGFFCLICHPHPYYPSHLLCSSLSRILGSFGSGSDTKHISSSDFWVTLYIIYESLKQQHWTLFLKRSMRNMRSTEL